jgi:(R)-amidase
MKIELVQLSGRDGDTAYNLERTLQAIATCAVDTDLLIFPAPNSSPKSPSPLTGRVCRPCNAPYTNETSQR